MLHILFCYSNKFVVNFKSLIACYKNFFRGENINKDTKVIFKNERIGNLKMKKALLVLCFATVLTACGSVKKVSFDENAKPAIATISTTTSNIKKESNNKIDLPFESSEEDDNIVSEKTNYPMKKFPN